MHFTNCDDRAATVGGLLRERARLSPDKCFIQMVDGDACTYGQANEQAYRLASGLKRLGVEHGHCVVIMLRNSIEAIHSWLAVNVLGAIEVSINTGYRGAPLEHAINMARAEVMIVGEEFLPQLGASAANLKFLKTVVVVGAKGQIAIADGIDALSYEEIAAPAGDVDFPECSHADIASVIYTSGTSGPAKGVMMPHAQVVLLARQMVHNCRFTANDVYYCFHPMYHMAGKFMGVLATLVAGATVVLDSQFSAQAWLHRVRTYGATISGAHGPMLEMIFALEPSSDDKRHALRTICSAPFPRHIAAAFERRFGVRGLEVWGMTEVGIPVWSPIGEALREGACGKVDEAHFEFCIVDPATDEPLPAGTTGEFLIRPKQPWTLMQGYMGMPEKTLEAWRNLWFHTGDAGYMDKDGYVYFVDRLSDRIRRRAENISSYDIEIAALKHPKVLEAAAVGVPSEFADDDEIKLCVVCKKDETADPYELVAYLASVLPHYMVPRYLEFLAELPRSATNKVSRAALKKAPYSTAVWDRKAHGISLRELVCNA